MEPRDASGYGEPKRWLLAFGRKTESWWVRWLACGKYKHVCAFGYVVESDCWVFYDVRLHRTHVFAARELAATRAMAIFAADADLVGIDAQQRARGGIRFGFWCVPAVKHLIGLRSGALRPDRLFADCLAQGAEIIRDEGECARVTA